MTEMAEAPHKCLDCGARWATLGLCHCTTCHANLAGIAAFDEHRKHGSCIDVARSRRFVEVKPGVFSFLTGRTT